MQAGYKGINLAVLLQTCRYRQGDGVEVWWIQ